MAVERTTTTTTSTGATTPPPTQHETVRDREVIREHHSDGDRGLGTLIVGAMLVLVVAFLGIYMVNAMSDSGSDVLPDSVNVDITDPNGGTDDGGEAETKVDNAPAPADGAPADEAPAGEAPAEPAPAE